MKFRTKTVLGITLIQAVLLTVLVVSVLSQMRSACQQQIDHRASVTAQLLAAAARDAMVAYDVSTLHNLATELVASGQVAYVDFRDEQDKHMVSVAPGSRPAVATQAAPDEDMLVRNVVIEVAGKRYGTAWFGIQLDEMTALLVSVKNRTIAIALGVMAAVAVFSMLLGQLLTRSLTALNVASREIATGNLTHQIDAMGNDELAETARGFNEMARQLAAIHAEHTSTLEELRTLAYQDALTGAHNRRSFLSVLEQEVLRVQRTGASTALVMIDIDHFKHVNDTWGHDAGDAVLKHLVAVLQNSLRRIDTLGRLGGEEFAVLLPETTLDGAVELANRLRLSVQDSPAAVINPTEGLPPATIPFTISLGVATLAASDSQVNSVLKRADMAMYQAKTTGRNKVCVATTPDTTMDLPG